MLEYLIQFFSLNTNPIINHFKQDVVTRLTDADFDFRIGRVVLNNCIFGITDQVDQYLQDFVFVRNQ